MGSPFLGVGPWLARAIGQFDPEGRSSVLLTPAQSSHGGLN